MAPKPIPDYIIEQVKQLWAQDTRQSALKVHERVTASNGGRVVVSARKVQQVIAEAKQRFPTEPPVYAVWKPWVNPDEDPEDTEFLLKMRAVKWAATGSMVIEEHEANWGKRLRTALSGLPLWHQFVILRLYTFRQQSSDVLRLFPPYTEDLDNLLSYRPWVAGNERAYQLAIDAGFAPHPGGWFTWDVPDESNYWGAIEKAISLHTDPSIDSPLRDDQSDPEATRSLLRYWGRADREQIGDDNERHDSQAG